MKNKDLAESVRLLRKRKGFSQEKLAQESALSLRTIQRIESGDTDPTGDTLKRLAEALDVTPYELIDWTVKEDIGFLKALNLSALTFVLFPLLGILVPLILWISKKDKLKGVNRIGKDLINFEITWAIIYFLGLLIAAIVLASKIDSSTELLAQKITAVLRASLIITALSYLFNCTIIIINAFRISKRMKVWFYPKISLIR